jgi:NADPH-dependent curcumin reductase CurA
MAPRFFSEIPSLVAQGKLKIREHLTYGIENGAAAFVEMLKPGNIVGKPIIVVADA